MAPKSGNNYTAIKLISQALTGATKTMYVKKTAPRVHLVKYDPIADRHCLFIEDNKRKIKGTATPPK
ncbi:hypothetical protein ACO0OE_003244 [Hanseniaspora uvarum]|jgi:large subunit ribosomal protein L33|nr:mitochondrial 54S ribosomal protein YmL39 [Hanseniaspora uvarum]